VPHSYDNFDDAYVGLCDSWTWGIYYFNKFNQYKNTARNRWNTGQDHEAIGYMLTALDYLQDSLNNLPDYSAPNYLSATLTESIYWANTDVSAPPLDMDAILSAMITADLSQFQKFIGIEDAYRMSLWNKPFNIEFYAALARGFM